MSKHQWRVVGGVVAKCWLGYSNREPNGTTEEAVGRATNMLRDQGATEEMVRAAIALMCCLSSEAGGVLEDKEDCEENERWINGMIDRFGHGV